MSISKIVWEEIFSQLEKMNELIIEDSIYLKNEITGFKKIDKDNEAIILNWYFFISNEVDEDIFITIIDEYDLTLSKTDTKILKKIAELLKSKYPNKRIIIDDSLILN